MQTHNDGDNDENDYNTLPDSDVNENNDDGIFG